MGIFAVSAKLYREFPPADGRPVALELMVDTGATFTMIPREVLAQLGIRAVGRRKIFTVEHKLVERDLGYVAIEVAGERVLSPVLFGEPDDFAVLGAVTLEIAGLAVDPERKELFPRPSLLLGH